MSQARTRVTVAAIAAALTVTVAACGSDSSSYSAATKSAPTAAATAAAPSLQGDVTFNDDKLSQLKAQLQTALQGKDLSKVDPAVVVNVTAAYWDAAKQGVENANKDLGVKAKFQEPSKMDISEQLSILNTLLSQDPETWGGLAGLPQV